MSQNQIVLAHLRKHGKITQLQATLKWGITRLSPRIDELEDKGVKIRREYVPKDNGHNDCIGQYAVYHYEGEHKDR